MIPSAEVRSYSFLIQVRRHCIRTVVAFPLTASGLTAILSAFAFTSVLWADQPLEYNRDIRPILSDHCFACHGADSAAREADLRLDVRDAAIAGGVLEPGDAEASALVARITSSDSDLRMPPPETKKTLTAEQIDLLRRWVDAGAIYQPHWSFIAPQPAQPPQVEDDAWVKNDIDRFVLHRLEASGLAPAPEADARNLFRRLHLDITGLPPAPSDVDRFEREFAQGGDSVLSQWIDQLMNSPAWGEHRARYWLDAARYGDTHGLHFDNYREMWPYRDWVIRAFNNNQRFDQFTVEQLAGDLLDDPSEDQLIATGFQRCNITTNEGGTIDEENLALYATDRVQTFGWVFLGLTTNCAQCHDHKFDPISMRDYYSLAAYFRNTTQPAKDGNVKDGRSSVIRIPSREDRPRWEALPGAIAAAKARRDERRREVQPEFEGWLAETSPESLEAQIPQVGLLAHLPLNEGIGNTVKSFAFAELTANAGELSSQTDANQATPAAANIDHVGPAVKATGELTWVPDGQLGPAPVMALGRSLELGGLGNFQWDESFSVGAWIRSPNKNINGGIIARMDEKDAYRGWDLYQGGGKIAVHIIQSWSDNALKVATKRDVITPNQWQHVLATYDGSGKPEGIKIYLNGQPEELQTEANTLKSDANVRTATPLRIGQRSDTQAFDGGAIQDMRLYGRALSAEEVSAIAGIGPLQALLTTPAAERTAEQQATLLEFYLTNYDAQFPTLVKALADLEAERNAIEQRSPVTHIQQEKMDSAPMANILMRGEYDQVGAEVPAAPPAALHALPSDAPNNRLGLAQWVVDPANPLTSRVVVNRFWQQLFGRGLVATTEDFGTTGTLPSHPELLDWLAIDFREGGWDVKRFFKQMLMSATYRQAAVTTPEKFELDRDNVLLSRGPRFRMDAEMVRDYALSASGLLSSKMFGPGVKPYQPDKIWDMVGLPGGDTRDYKPDSGEDLYRRTVYTFWKRMAPPPNLEAFNAPSREVCTVRRERTNTPLQALVTLNDPQFVEAARSLAEVSVTAALQDDSSIVDTIALRVLGRKFSERERQIVMASQQEIMAYYQAHPEDAQALLDVGDSKPQANLPSATLATWTMICNQIMNLDETLNK